MSLSVEVAGLDHGAQPIPIASRVGPLVMSGSISGIDRHTRELPEDAASQVRNAFANVAAIMDAVGGSLSDIAKLDIRVTSRNVRTELNPVWLETFPDPRARPARHVTVQPDLPAGLHLQCELTAWVAGKAPAGRLSGPAGPPE